ncbi:hypothetical protein RvY_06664 [Ramazzottius varieornatus]|uniref:Uncharacterized protein n=1 Tax=Ramazzottius varieornatus TaxID=947166 RepID=A0A1D1V289_RAMVA|nr:hypothetical protein RvY_06664 [Ramazzottius varieornatus]
MSFLGILTVFIGICCSECVALQCFVCSANLIINRDCRALSAARLIDCPDTSTHCNAIVTDVDGRIIVNRGCSGNVFSWGFGNDECDIMTNERILDKAVAFYQCRGDACNNVEPGEVTTVTQVVNGVDMAVPRFAMKSNMQSQRIMDHDVIASAQAVITDQDDNMRRGKQLTDATDDEDDSYGLPGKQRRTRTTITTTTTTTQRPRITVSLQPRVDEFTTERTTRPTTTRTTTPVRTAPPPPPTRPHRPRNFTIFDRR